MGRFPPAIGLAQRTPVADKDRAQTFAESELSSSLKGTTVAGEGVELVRDATSSSGSFGGSVSDTGVYGLQFTPQTDAFGIETTALWGGSAANATAYLYDSNNNLLDSKAIDEASSFQLLGSLNAGESYKAVVDNSGSSWSPQYDTAAFPEGNSVVSVDAGIDGDLNTTTNSRWYVLRDSFALIPATGSATIEWPVPTDLYAWDLGKYLVNEDGGSITVAVEEADGQGGWNEVIPDLNNPGDLSGLDPERNVRFRVDFSRPSTAENPRLEAIYRRYKL